MSYYMQSMPSPVGELFLVEKNQSLAGLYFHQPSDITYEMKETSLLASAKRQLDEYFAGQRQTFDLPLSPQGTEFQQRAWHALSKIPFGAAVSYKEQAISMGQPKAVRAVGRANGLNPLPIIVPCHRVLGSDGSLTGYAGGIPTKKYLLDLEKNLFNSSR